MRHPLNSDPSPAKSKKLLIITSSGGGGLIQAAVAKEQEEKARDPNIEIIKRDVMKDWMHKRFGQYCVNRWNNAQLRGDVAAQRFCAWAQNYAEYLFWPNFFFCTLYTLFKYDVGRVIDTQPIGTSAILLAIRIYNQRRNKEVRLEKVLVDLPTKLATHFFTPIKKLSRKNRSFLKLITVAPLLEEGQTSEEFWQTNCSLKEEEIAYEDVYVRQSFRKYQNLPRVEETMALKIRYKNEEELGLIKNAIARTALKPTFRPDEVEFLIPPKDKVITILLGSQPANEATLNYVKKFLQIAKESEIKTKTHLFVFCADHLKEQKSSLFMKVSDYVAKLKEYPKHFSVIPFSFQNDDVVAPLFFRSDLTCTRSGGQTAMELMCVSRGEIWIHSEAKKKEGEELTLEELLSGIPGWEAANASYLQKIRGAKISTPETFASEGRRLLRIDPAQMAQNPFFERTIESTA
ncbi:MAG: hypothetical protein A3E80_00305 [Chlamydiae bacterium RIFCSPHIGHO2_12_FULL_49_9]|nr:MAG: hypothetical protein A3E80_00305 [Chlamydiae bacterium RIFCSPHIGHO2_12_FULL_49_9]